MDRNKEREEMKKVTRERKKKESILISGLYKRVKKILSPFISSTIIRKRK